jgi:hypothetical protein
MDVIKAPVSYDLVRVFIAQVRHPPPKNKPWGIQGSFAPPEFGHQPRKGHCCGVGRGVGESGLWCLRCGDVLTLHREFSPSCVMCRTGRAKTDWGRRRRQDPTALRCVMP